MRIHFYNRKYEKDIVGKAKTTSISGLEWQDIAQELDIILWLKLCKFQGRNGASERTFAQKIMRNRILDLAKSANRKKRYIDSNHVFLSQFEDIDELEGITPIGEGIYHV